MPRGRVRAGSGCGELTLTRRKSRRRARKTADRLFGIGAVRATPRDDAMPLSFILPLLLSPMKPILRMMPSPGRNLHSYRRDQKSEE